jgi:MoxR-like ATPase
LPEAQLDRFMMKIKLQYQSREIEKEIYKKNIFESENMHVEKVLTKEEIIQMQKKVKEIFISDNIFDYVSYIVDATRNPSNY